MILVTGEEPANPGRWKSGKSGAVQAAATAMVRAGMNTDLIAAVFFDEGLLISEHVLSQTDPQRAVVRAITRAKEIIHG